MSDVTVAQFAEVLKVPVDRLLVQLESAGIQVAGPQALISDEAKLELLTHLRRSHGAAEPTSKSQLGVRAPRERAHGGGEPPPHRRRGRKEEAGRGSAPRAGRAARPPGKRGATPRSR